jgi:hypothetical protein
MLSDAGSFAAAISWTVQLLAVPPWTALYALIVNWGTFSYGDRVLDWFAYDICGLLVGFAYVCAGTGIVCLSVGLFLLLGRLSPKRPAESLQELKTEQEQHSRNRHAGPSVRSFLLIPFLAVLLVGAVLFVVGSGVLASAFVSATVAFICGTTAFIQGRDLTKAGTSWGPMWQYAACCLVTYTTHGRRRTRNSCLRPAVSAACLRGARPWLFRRLQ